MFRANGGFLNAEKAEQLADAAANKVAFNLERLKWWNGKGARPSWQPSCLKGLK